MNGGFEMLHGFDAELDGPHDGVGSAQGLYRAAPRYDVCVVTRLNGLLRTDFYAVVRIPTLFLIPGLPDRAGVGAVHIELHQVMGADVPAAIVLNRYVQKLAWFSPRLLNVIHRYP